MLNKHTDVLFSIIIPLYNAEKYLNKCLNSILRQNTSKLEIILINDCSNDRSKKICNSFKKKIKIIKVFNNSKRLGVSVSRNKGIREARGNFLIFLDSDDFLLKDCINDLRKLVEKNADTDLILAQKFVALSRPNTFTVHNVFKTKLLNKKNYGQIINGLCKETRIYGNIYNYIINRNFLIKKKIYFTPNISYGEDREFVVKILCFCKKFCFYKKSFYCFCSGSGNLSNAMSFNIALSCLKVVNNLSILIKSNFLSKNKKLLIKNSIRQVLNEFIPRLIYLEENKILKLSKYIRNEHKNFNLVKFAFLGIEISNTLKKYGYYKGLILYRLALTRKILTIIKRKTFNKIYVFCSNYYAIATAKILLENGYCVEGILDNNKVVFGKKILGLQIYSPYFLRTKSIKYKSSILVLITNQFKNNIKRITDQLMTLGIKRKQVVYKIFE